MSNFELATSSSGRRIAYSTYGARDGEPVFFFHGWPSSRIQAESTHEAARELGLRIISIDRPGTGRSDYHPGRKLTDWPELLCELASHLRIDTFRVLGVSGGGPYALISAWAFPDRVSAATVVSGAPPLLDLPDHSGLMPVYRLMLEMYGKWPEFLRLLLIAVGMTRRIPAPSWAYRLVARFMPKADGAMLSKPEINRAFWMNFRETWNCGAHGVLTDAGVYATPWGFRLEEISVPVHFWHGAEDAQFSAEMIRQYASRIPQAEIRIVPGEGHYSLALGRTYEILADLKSAAAPIGRSGSTGISGGEGG